MLSTEEPWDTMKAQLLVKISAALDPKVLEFDLYETFFYIPRILPKPGMALPLDADYDLLIRRARNLMMKDPTIYLVIIEKGEMGTKKMILPLQRKILISRRPKNQWVLYLWFRRPFPYWLKTHKDSAMLPRNVNKNAYIQALCEEWKCTKAEAAFPGSHCYVNPDTGVHLPLSHEKMDCWASAVVS